MAGENEKKREEEFGLDFMALLSSFLFKGKRALQFAGDHLVGLYRFCGHQSYHFFFFMFVATEQSQRSKVKGAQGDILPNI